MSICRSFENKVVAFTGAHGTGKTTAVYQMAHRLKMENPGKEVGVVMETARRCPLGFLSDGRQIIDEASQRWIFAAQILAELEAAQRYDLVVSDRTVCDCIAYTILGGHHMAAMGMMGLARAHMRVYREVRLLRIADHDRLVSDGVRNTDRLMRERMEDHLMDIYRELAVPVVEEK